MRWEVNVDSLIFFQAAAMFFAFAKNSCSPFDMEGKRGTALGIGGAHRRGVPERSGGMITPESPTAACGGNAQMKK